MELTAELRTRRGIKEVSINVPVISNALLPVPLVDSRWARPYVFRNVANYPLSEYVNTLNDYSRFIELVNATDAITDIERYKGALLKIVDEHIAKCGRLLFCDLLMYVDCVAYICYATDLMSESQIVDNYAHWVKYVVEKRRNSLYCSTRWGIGSFSGSMNEKDLDSCF